RYQQRFAVLKRVQLPEPLSYAAFQRAVSPAGLSVRPPLPHAPTCPPMFSPLTFVGSALLPAYNLPEPLSYATSCVPSPPPASLYLPLRLPTSASYPPMPQRAVLSPLPDSLCVPLCLPLPLSMPPSGLPMCPLSHSSLPCIRWHLSPPSSDSKPFPYTPFFTILL
ncbi:unnamed protein product, partial [Closterium sp. NIES-53]